MYRFLLSVTISLVSCSIAIAQLVPNCRDINVSVDAAGQVALAPADLITNVASGIDTVTIRMEDQLESVVYGPYRIAVDSILTIPACPYVGKVLKAVVSNSLGSCWSEVTFKKTLGPVVAGRVFNVYCFDPLVQAPDDLPPVLNPCEPANNRPDYITDWIVSYPCEDGVQDTAKVIYREWEVLAKDGSRGVGFDTLIVFKIPEITAENIWCTAGDTIYCTDFDSLTGPYITIPEIPGDPMSACLEVPLLDFTDADVDGVMEVSARAFDDKCGLSVHVDLESFEVDCQVQYRIALDVKQSCYGAPQTICTVPAPAGTPPNSAEQRGPGYWSCLFWVVDQDTLPPVIHCKDPLLFNGVFDQDYWIAQVEGSARIDTQWLPYHLLLESNDLGGDSLIANYCLAVPKDTVVAFSWEYTSQDTDAGSDPFGYTLNGVFHQLTKGDLMGQAGPTVQQGYRIVELTAGDEFCFTLYSWDGMNGAATTVIKPLKVVSTSADQCVAHTYLPDVTVMEDWSGIKAVKATVPGIGTYILEYDAQKKCFKSHDRVPLPQSYDPYTIYYEAYDSCHNVAIDSCYLLVKDRIRPVAVIDKGLTINLSGKKIWLEAESLNEGSTDNCGLNLLLARRVDWYEACIELCDSIAPICITEHHDTLWKAYLQPDKFRDEVEAHYVENLWNWKEEDVPCSNILYNAWMLDLIKHASLNCNKGYYQDAHALYGLIESCLPVVDSCFLPVPLHPEPYDDTEVDSDHDFKFDRRLLDMYAQLGGGWSDAVPFDCEDACSAVTVEVLVMDYWCNWSKAWTQVWVEDNTPARIVKDVEDTDITCKIYKTPSFEVMGENHPLSIASIVDLAKDKDERALNALDAIFGGYQKVWQDEYGQYIDTLGEVVKDYVAFTDSACYCEIDEIIPVRHYDEHLGAYWTYDTTYICGYEPVYDTLSQGLVLANCAGLVDCEQEVWCDIDHCGEGYIYRKFKIWQGCPAGFYQDETISDSLKLAHVPDTLIRTQRIRVYNECSLDPHFFKRPADVTIQACRLEYDEDGSGKVGGLAHPDHTGWLQYAFDDDCRLVGVAYDDRVFKVVGGDEGCYKIRRTWYYMDWCAGQPTAKYWYKDESLEIDSFIQYIILNDTVPPTCTIIGPVGEGDTISTAACSYNFTAEFLVSDTCGVESYAWYLKDVTYDDQLKEVASGSGELHDTSGSISVEGLAPGSYRLYLELEDICNNEGLCTYDFVVSGDKKPAAICLSTITARLNPMDRDNDGIADTAMVTIWADEIDQSSAVACRDTALELRLVRIDGVDDDIIAGTSDSVTFGCNGLGMNRVRLWVISHPSGTFDFCDVYVMVQGDGLGCPESEEPQGPVSAVNTVPPVRKPVVRTPDSGPVFTIHDIPPRLQADVRSDQAALWQNYPNPFADQTRIEFYIPQGTDASLTIYDVTGKQLFRMEADLEAGFYSQLLDRAVLNHKGIYYYQLKADNFVQTRKMILLD